MFHLDYILVHETSDSWLSWANASFYCTNTIGSQLASFAGWDRYNEFKSLAQTNNLYDENIYVGARKVDNTWGWVDNSEFNWTDWYSDLWITDGSNERCSYLYYTGQRRLNDCDCFEGDDRQSDCSTFLCNQPNPTLTPTSNPASNPTHNPTSISTTSTTSIATNPDTTAAQELQTTGERESNDGSTSTNTPETSTGISNSVITSTTSSSTITNTITNSGINVIETTTTMVEKVTSYTSTHNDVGVTSTVPGSTVSDTLFNTESPDDGIINSTSSSLINNSGSPLNSRWIVSSTLAGTVPVFF